MLGMAKDLKVKVFECNTGVLEKALNDWLSRNGNVEVVDIKFSSAGTHDDWSADAIVIYKLM